MTAHHMKSLCVRIVWACLPLVLASCAAPILTPDQRQQVETQVHEASYDETFRAARDTMVNQRFVITESDYGSGVMTVNRAEGIYNPQLALGLSFVAPAGDIYVGRYHVALLDTICLPIAWLWAMPVNYRAAKNQVEKITGNISLERLGDENTRVRVTFHGIPWNTEEYPPRIKFMHERIGRQIFIKKADRLTAQR